MAKGRISIIDAVRELKAQSPFEPFRIVMTGGDKYQIDDGGNLVEMRTQFFYVNPRTDRFVFMRMSEIAAVETFGPVEKKRRAAG
jgi:hypothetical protein